MRQSSNTSTYLAIIEAISSDQDEALDDLVAGNFIDHNAVPGQPAGLVGLKYWMASARTAFPDLTGTTHDTVADGEKVAGRVSWHGTHRGEFVGVPATGASVDFSAFHIVRFTQGLAVEWWGTADLLGALTQIGATISPPVAGIS